MEAQHQVTRLLVELNEGRREALDELLPLVYDEMRRIAARHLYRESAGHTLQPTALVHEAFLKLVGQDDSEWKNRLHFLSVASTVMRRVLIDHARAKRREKRGGGAHVASLDGVEGGGSDGVFEVLAIDRAIEKLQQLDPVQARIVELRFFGGVSVEEAAEILNLSTATVKRYTNSARAWLQREINRGGA